MNSNNQKYDLTIGMIVKNEEKCLEKCLTALLPLKELISCEIIVTDTGSTDKTVEIAEKYADTVLDFTWCDDFSKARNVGVEIAKGDWFMYIDADEVLDNSVVKIADFIKSKDRDTYSDATVIIRNYLDFESKNFDDVMQKRLFSLTDGKRLFDGKIQESVPCVDKIFNIDFLVFHNGLNPILKKFKKARNRDIIEPDYEQSTNDFKLVKLMCDCVEKPYDLFLYKKGIETACLGADNDYEDITNPEYISLLFCGLAFYYLRQGDKNHLIIETCEQYFDTKLVQLYNNKPCFPTLEIYFILAFAYYQKNDNEKALEYFVKYQEMFEVLEKEHNSFLEFEYQYKFNTEIEYEKSGNFLMEIYRTQNDEEKFYNQLNKSQLYKFAFIDEQLVNIYIQRIIKYNRKDLFEKAMNYFNTNELMDKSETIQSVLVAKIYFDLDLSYFMKNYSMKILNKTLTWSYKHIPEMKKMFCDILSNDIEVNDLKELKIFIQIAYFYLISEIDILFKENVDLNFRKKVDDIFTLYVESVLYYLNALHTPVMLQAQNLEILPREEAMCVVLGVGFETRDTNRVGYIKSLKEALKFNESFKYIILNSIYLIENQIEEVEEVEVEVGKNEFELLAVKIKQTISSLIVSKELGQAKDILEQYKSINPTDPDIEKFLKLLI